MSNPYPPPGHYPPPHPAPSGSTGVAVTAWILPLAFLGGPLIVALAMWFVLGSTEEAMAPTPALLVPLVAAGGAYAMAEAIGYRARPLPLGMPPAQATRTAGATWLSRMIIRLVLADVVLFVSLAAAFIVTTGAFLITLTGALLTVVLVALLCLPRRRSVDRVATALEAGGTPSGLRQAFGYA